MHFVNFYAAKNPSKRLAWCLSQGTATLRIVFTENAKDVKVSTLQAVVLLWFNARASCTVEELAATTGIDKGDLKRVVAPMVLAKGFKILKKEPATSSIKDTDVLEIDLAFKSPKRVCVPVDASLCVHSGFFCHDIASHSGVCPLFLLLLRVAALSALWLACAQEISIPTPLLQAKTTESGPAVEPERNEAVDAAIVRIMKSRKILHHQELVHEVLTQVSGLSICCDPVSCSLMCRMSTLVIHGHCRT